MPRAGRKALVKVSSTAVPFTDEATSTSDDQTYQIDDAAKRVWGRTGTITVYEGGVATAESYTLNRLTGKITFATVDATRGAVTVDGSYLPMTTAGEAREYTWALEADNQDDTKFQATHISRVQGLKDFTASLSQFYLDETFAEYLLNDSVIVLEFYSDSSATFDIRAWAISASDEISAAADGLVEESVEFEGTNDADGRMVSIA